MKKIGAIVFISFLFFAVGCEKEMQEKEKIQKPKEQIKEKYEDTNPIMIGLYEKGSTSRHLVQEYRSEWALNKDILILSAIGTQKTEVELGALMDVFPKYWNPYEKATDYKIGYRLAFEMEYGESIKKEILTPEDTKDIYNYIQVYLYDDIHQQRNSFYTHVEEMKENTLLTTIKLTGSTLTHGILSPLKLSVFTYKDENDFDKDGYYRGKSIYTVSVIKDHL